KQAIRYAREAMSQNRLISVVRHMALNVLKQHPAKISLARKRCRCSYDDAFLASVFFAFRA
ncbi:MAG: hypothetical protein ACI4TG_00540, partial [Ruminococcus sp.]